jgi:hypothetical protein
LPYFVAAAAGAAANAARARTAMVLRKLFVTFGCSSFGVRAASARAADLTV